MIQVFKKPLALLAAVLAAPPLWANALAARAARAPAPARVTLNFHWASQDRSAFLKELDRHVDALAALPGVEPSAPLPAVPVLAYLRRRAGRSLATPVQLAARQTLLNALARPSQDLPRISSLLRAEGGRGRRTARKLEMLAGRADVSPERPRLYSGLTRLRRALMPNARGLKEGSLETFRLLAAAFDGKPFSGEEDLPAAAVRAEFSDRRFGSFNQDAPRLRALGLFSRKRPEHTALCGPVCLLNAAPKLVGRGARTWEPGEELERVVWDLAPLAGRRGEDLLEGGIRANYLAELARAYLREKGREAVVRVVEAPRITEKLLRSAADGDTALILNYGKYTMGRRGQPRRVGGHYVLLSGLQAPRGRGRPLRVLVQDPARGESVVRLTLRGQGRRRAYVLEFEDPAHPANRRRRRLLLESVVEIRASP